MKPQRPIGFLIPGNGTQNEPQTPKNNPDEPYNPAENLIKQTYSPHGAQYQTPEYISPMDLWDTLSAYITISKDNITQAMENLGFKHAIIEGEPYWIVYTRQS